MAVNYGKKFEQYFSENWARCFPGRFLFRLKDQMSGFKEVSGNPCDFLCFDGANHLLMVECKEHKGASIPFTAIPQYERLLAYKNKLHTYPGILVWFMEKDKLIWVSIDVAEKIHEAGYKSIGLSLLGNPEFDIFEIPTEKKRVNLEADYYALMAFLENRDAITSDTTSD